jgi:hypothetical protein
MQTDRGHQLQIEAAQIHKFCAYQGNRVTPWLVAHWAGRRAFCRAISVT